LTQNKLSDMRLWAQASVGSDSLARVCWRGRYEEGWIGLARSQLEQGDTRWDDAEATLRAFLRAHSSSDGSGNSGGGGGVPMVGVGQQLLEDLAHRRQQARNTEL
jgi:hypothetical protein